MENSQHILFKHKRKSTNMICLFMENINIFVYKQKNVKMHYNNVRRVHFCTLEIFCQELVLL